MQLSELIYERVKTLPEPLALEVLNYISYLNDKEARQDINELMKLQQQSLDAIWDNPEDDVWNDL
jgi:Protein of unknown function (DUF2281)